MKDLIFLDESGANLQLAPLYGRSRGKSRVHYAVPFNRGKRLTLISAISIEKVEAALYGEWNANGDIFLQFIRDCLCPVLCRGKVVIMDNVSFHQVAGVEEAIRAAGARLIYLPPYSPDLNPIEPMWGKIKTDLRKFSARTIDQFNPAIAAAFQYISSKNLRGWYKHCGYIESVF